MFDIIIRPDGDLVDFNTWDEFAEFLAKLGDLGEAPIILDLVNVNRMSSNYIGTIISIFKAVKERGRPMSLINVQPKMFELLDMLRLTDVMDIRPA